MKKRWIWGPAIIAVTLWIMWIAQEFIFQLNDLPWKGETLGQLGDTFGALNALFSAFALIAILFTLKQQQEALSEQQKQIDKSESNHHKQRFEDIFFQLLSVIRENRQDVRFANSKEYLADNPKAIEGTKKGQFAFRAAYRELRYWVKREIRSDRQLDRNSLAEIFADKVHAKYESALGAYFRLVYETLDRVERNERLSAEEKNEFGNLVRGQMTSFETAIAGCNALTDFAKDFERLINRFRLLKYARTGEVYNELTKHYPPETFQGRETKRPPHPEQDDEVDDDREHAE